MTLTDPEVRLLLGHAMAYDNRKVPGDANRAAWAEAARRANWTLPAAIEALHQHYATSSEFVMPGHITALIKAERRQPAPFEPLPPRPQLPAGVDVHAMPDIDAATADRPLPGRRNPLSRWSSRASRRVPLAEVRAEIEAQLEAARRRQSDDDRGGAS